MAVTYKGRGDSVLLGTPETRAFTLPATPEVGDWIIGIITGDWNAGNTRKPIPPAGWVTIRDWLTVGTGNMALGVYAKMYAGPSDLQWTNLHETSWAVTRGFAIWGSGSDVANWTVGAQPAREENGTTTTAKAPPVGISGPGLLLLLSTERTSAAETPEQISISNGFTKVIVDQNADSQTTTIVGTKSVAAPGTSGETIVTVPNIHALNAIAFHIYMPEAYAPSPAIPARIFGERGYKLGGLKVSNGNQLIYPPAIKTVTQGYGTVDNMLSKPVFKIAHRGGSANWPEMSAKAYGAAALWGMNALEFSVARTSDGVYFGLHDETLQRTSGVNILPANITWNQLQQYTTFGAPYAKLTDIMAMYPNHVMFIDPKATHWSAFPDLLDLLDRNGGKDRFVAKYWGGASHGFIDLARARGYKAWGYYYIENEAIIETSQNRWDLIGMEHNASKALWDLCLSFGKPVIAHICVNSDHRADAIAKGAKGLMISGVKAGDNT